MFKSWSLLLMCFMYVYGLLIDCVVMSWFLPVFLGGIILLICHIFVLPLFLSCHTAAQVVMRTPWTSICSRHLRNDSQGPSFIMMSVVSKLKFSAKITVTVVWRHGGGLKWCFFFWQPIFCDYSQTLPRARQSWLSWYVHGHKWGQWVGLVALSVLCVHSC